MSQTYSDEISIHEVYKIDHTDPDEPIQIRLLAECTTGDALEFKAPKRRGKRRRNFFGKTLKTAVMLHPDTLSEGEGLGLDSKCDKKYCQPMNQTSASEVLSDPESAQAVANC